MKTTTGSIMLVVICVSLLTGCTDDRVKHFKDGGSLHCVNKNLITDDVHRTVSISSGWEYQAAPYRGCSVFKRKSGWFKSESFCVDQCDI